MIIMDFSKAFDKVPHRRLQYKLDWYGIRGSTHNWIQHFLQGRSQRVVSEGSQSSPHPVLSGVPQGTVLGPILFLIYINDLPDEAINSTIRLFADDCILYRSIKTEHDSTLLQTDLNSIAHWELTWQMKFNIDKCYTMQVGRKRHNILNTYTLNDHPLPITDSAKYLGITISNDLKWNKHVSNITSKANSTLGILRRNLRLSSHTVKTHAYQALGRVHTTGLKPERFRNRSSCPCSDLFHCVHSFRNEPTTSRCDRSGTVPEPFRLALWCERSTGPVPERVQSARSLRVHVCLRARARA